jgi:23S rRNA (adenine1618-N6)-methyltransferase
MSLENSPQEKTTLHPRNKNRERYDLNALVVAVPELADYVKPNKYGDDSVDFSSPVAVKLLNKALLAHYYNIQYWEFSDDNLVPPIPGRADYIHYMADLLKESNFGRMPEGNRITCIDIGTGANCIYPIIGVTEYNWNFIATDVNSKSLASAQNIVENNASLKGIVECRLQKNPNAFFDGILQPGEKADLTVCNPPFHASAEDAQAGTKRKVQNLSGKRVKTPELNFAGISNELIYEGGEHRFIHKMIADSKRFSKDCYWFSTLVSKQSNLKGIYKALDDFKAADVKTIEMGTGNKSTRIVAWTFLTKEEQKEWRDARWKIPVK